MFYIYEIKNLLNNKTYIGQRKCPANKTPETDSYMGSGDLIRKAIKKYGLQNFSKLILESNIGSKKEVDKREIYWISKYKEQGGAEYNLSTGGTGGNLGEYVNKLIKKSKENISEETRRKMSESAKKKIFTEEHRRNIGISSMGNRSRKGQHISEEQKKKQSEALSGKNFTIEHKKKISDALKGHKGFLAGKHWKIVDGKRIIY